MGIIRIKYVNALYRHFYGFDVLEQLLRSYIFTAYSNLKSHTHSRFMQGKPINTITKYIIANTIKFLYKLKNPSFNSYSS